MISSVLSMSAGLSPFSEVRSTRYFPSFYPIFAFSHLFMFNILGCRQMSHQLLLSLDKSIVALCLIASLIPYLSTTTVIAQRTSTTLFQPPSTLPPSPEKTLLSKRPTPTSPPTPQYKVVQQSGIPKGAVVVSGLPALECFTKDQSGTWISNRSLPTGLVWLPNVPWMEPGKTVHIDTDSHGIEFKNISFSNHTSNIHPYKSLLHTYSNKSGWSMVMPTSGHVDSKSGILSSKLYDLNFSMNFSYWSNNYLDCHRSDRLVILQLTNDRTMGLPELQRV